MTPVVMLTPYERTQAPGLTAELWLGIHPECAHEEVAGSDGAAPAAGPDDGLPF